jgi:hypothetical protein
MINGFSSITVSGRSPATVADFPRPGEGARAVMSYHDVAKSGSTIEPRLAHDALVLVLIALRICYRKPVIDTCLPDDCLSRFHTPQAGLGVLVADGGRAAT